MLIEKTRCSWSLVSDLMQTYHDTEWGCPLYDDRKLFEFLILEGAQAGLSWATILKRREHYRLALDNFDAQKISQYSPDKIQQLLDNPNLIRHRLKIYSMPTNARVFLHIQQTWGCFSAYVWHFTNGKPIINHWLTSQDAPATSKESEAMANDLKKQGMAFVGSTICYAYMQAIGMVNDHIVTCFRRSELIN